MKKVISIKRKFVLFASLYTFFLLGSILLYFIFSGQSAINQQAKIELTNNLHFFNEFLDREIQSAAIELIGLQSNIEISQLQNRGIEDIPLEIIKDFVIARPYKFAEIQLLNQNSNEKFVITPIAELGQVDAEVRQVVLSSASQTGRIQDIHTLSEPFVSGPEAGSFGEALHIHLPIKEQSATLIGMIQINYLFDIVLEKMNLLPYFSVVVADTSGLVIYSQDATLLKKNIFDIWAGILANLHDDVATENRCRIIRDHAYITLLIDQPRVHIYFRKDLHEDLHMWRSKVLNVFIFVLNL